MKNLRIGCLKAYFSIGDMDFQTKYTARIRPFQHEDKTLLFTSHKVNTAKAYLVELLDTNLISVIDTDFPISKHRLLEICSGDFYQIEYTTESVLMDGFLQHSCFIDNCDY